MITRKSIFRMVSVLFIAVFLLMSVLPVQAGAFANPLYASGDFLWANGMGGPNQDEGNSITVDSAGNVYTTGDFQNTVDFDPGAGMANLTSAGGADIFISKSDSDGNFLWAKNIGGVGGDVGICIAVDSSGNIYTTGSFNGTVDFDPNAGITNLTSAGFKDIFISKLDSNGNFVWAKNMGGTYYDVGLDITLDSSGNVYTTGDFYGTVDFDPGVGTSNLISAGLWDIFISKLDNNGNFVWAKNMGGTGADVGLEVRLDSNGNIYTTGRFENTADFDPGASTSNLTSAGLYDSFISKLDNNGSFVWAKSMGGADDDDGYSIALDSNDNIYAMGGFSGTADFDPGPGVFNLTSAGYEDIFISKLDAGGDFLWAKSIGGTYYDYGGTIALDSGDNIYMTGDYAGTVDFDPGTGISNLISVGGSTDMFVSKSDSSGNFVWAKSMGGTEVDFGISIAVDSSGGIYTTGVYSGTADFDPGAGTSNLTSAGEWDIFVSKLYNVVVGSPQIYVNWNASGANNGTSWANAYTDLQSALLAAVSGQEIWVAAGMYKPTTSTDRAVSFVLKNGVAVYGGFAGTETLRAQHDPAANVTVLSGEIGAVGIADNSFHVIEGSGTNNTAILDGFTITKGNANDLFDPHAWGGGMHVLLGSPSLANLIFISNTAKVGGGIALDNSNSILLNVTFNGNSANFGGGGIYVLAGSPTLRNVTFKGNLAENGGGIAISNANPFLENVTFNGNIASNFGGGIYNGLSDSTLKNVTISGNTALAGGGMLNEASNPIITNSILWGDTGGEIENIVGGSPVVAYSIVQGGYVGTGNLSSNPLLSSLANNGGSTQTMALLPGSSAINAGDDANCPATDQRGVTRPQDTHCDIGAYEKAPVFADVSLSYWSNSYIERLYNAGITGGCLASPLNYCPEEAVTRAQMAVFLLKGIHGSSYQPPAINGDAGFADVATNHWAAPWIKQLFAEGITSGCGGGNYCPEANVSRAQMAIFLLKAKHGSAYLPPAATGVFTDVPVDHWARNWIEQLAVEGITSGCGAGTYCPEADVSRAQMAVFLVKTFNLP